MPPARRRPRPLATARRYQGRSAPPAERTYRSSPILAAHINEFGRYPISKGIEPFRRAASNWLARRYHLPRALDPETEILVLNGSREGLFFAAIAAARHVAPRKGTPAILLPNPFYRIP